MVASMKKRLLMVVVAVLLFDSSASANPPQSGASVLHAKEASKPPTDTVPVEDVGEVAGFHKGNLNPFFIQSPDGEFRLNIGALTQMRYNMVTRETPNAGDSRFDSGFVFARTRIFFEGKAGHHVHYELRLQINSEGDFNLLTAYAGYNFGDYGYNSRKNKGAWNLTVGRQFLAHMIDNWTYPQDTLTTEYAGSNYAFAIGVVDGAQAFFGKDRYRLWLAVSSGRQNPPLVAGGTGEVFGGSLRTGQIMFSGRGEVQLVGDNWNLYNDQVSRRKDENRDPGLRFGAAAAYSLGIRSEQPQPDPVPPKNAIQITMDLTASGSGWQVLAQGIWNWFSDPSAESRWGFLIQGGYFILEPWNVYLRYDLVDPGTQGDIFGQYDAVTLGTSYYPFKWTNRYKVSIEGGLLFNAISQTLVGANPTIGWLATDQGSQYYLRTQLQFGF
jgi:hypothetical protein